VFVRNLRRLMRRAAGQDREADPAVCLVSRWGECRSKQAYSRIANPLRAVARGAIVRAAIAVGMRFGPEGKLELAEQGRAAFP